MTATKTETEAYLEKEKEYADLMKVYLQVENDMRSFNDEMSNKFKKQQEKTEKMSVESFKLLEELQIQENASSQAKKEQGAAQKTIDTKLEEIAKLKERCERETNTCKRLDEKLKGTQSDIIQLKRKQSCTSGGAMNEKEKASQISKQVRIIENRLDQATKKYSETINKNKDQRE